MAIHSCGTILQEYDSDKKLAMYGFGGRINGQGVIGRSSCALSLSPPPPSPSRPHPPSSLPPPSSRADLSLFSREHEPSHALCGRDGRHARSLCELAAVCKPPLTPSLTPPLTPSLTPPLAPSLTPPLAPSLTPPLAPSLTPPLAPSLTLLLTGTRALAGQRTLVRFLRRQYARRPSHSRCSKRQGRRNTTCS
jgi:hypothetical protein